MRMNKKIIASLLTLGLVLGPVSGAVHVSYATEATSEKIDEKKGYDMIALIKANLEDFENTKKSDLFRLATSEKQEAIIKVMEESKAYLENSELGLVQLEACINAINKAYEDLVASANENLKNLKESIINTENLLKNHKNQKESNDYKELVDCIDASKEILKAKNLADIMGDELVDYNKKLTEYFEKFKKRVDDTKEYKASSAELTKLDEEINKEEEMPVDKKAEALVYDKDVLLKDHKEFVDSLEFRLADQNRKNAYIEAYKAVENLDDKAKFDDVYKAVKSLALARYDIDDKDLGLKLVKISPSSKEIEEKTVEVLKKLRAHVIERDKLLKNLKDEKLKNEYIEKTALAATYAINYNMGIKSNLKVYRDLNAKLDALKAKIEKEKPSETPSQKTKLDILKDDLERALTFKLNSSDYANAKKEVKDKLDEAIDKANELIRKGSVTDEEASKASDAIKTALANFTKFADKTKAKEALQKLLKDTSGIRIDQIYGKDEKESRDAYVKARERANKLVNDAQNSSLEDMEKAYKDFKEAVDKLAEFLNTRLKKLVDDDKNFRDSDKYKEALKDSNKEEAIKNYTSRLEEAEKILKEPVADANNLNGIYQKLKAARDEINGVIKTSWGRKLSDAIVDGYAFMADATYQKAAISSNSNLKDAAKNYKILIETAEAYKKAGKLDTEDAKDLLDAINHAKDFMEGKISEKKYLNNKNYHILKALTKTKGYKENINQATRDRIEKALKLYEENGDEEAIYKAFGEVMNDDAVKSFIQKIEAEKNPSKTRDNLLIKLRTMVDKDEAFRAGEKYKNAPKELKADYDRALEEAKKIIEAEMPTEKEVKDAYDKLKLAIDRIETRSIIDRRLVLLAEKFKKNQLKIGNVEARKAIAAKINALKENPYTTMEEVDAVEKELDNLINPKVVTTTTVVPKGQTPTTTRPVSTITNPGSIVKTGINGMAKVGAILVVALGILIFTRKKGDRK